jgi:hypothetical protein
LTWNHAPAAALDALNRLVAHPCESSKGRNMNLLSSFAGWAFHRPVVSVLMVRVWACESSAIGDRLASPKRIAVAREGFMADSFENILVMSDEELMQWLASELRSSYVNGGESATKMVETVLTMRATIKNLSAAKEVSLYTRDLAASTKNLAIGTWAIAVITLVTQMTLLILTLRR